MALIETLLKNCRNKMNGGTTNMCPEERVGLF